MNEKVIHSCKVRYVLHGASTRTCQANGLWSGKLPTCIRESVCACVYIYTAVSNFHWLKSVWFCPVGRWGYLINSVFQAVLSTFLCLYSSCCLRSANSPEQWRSQHWQDYSGHYSCVLLQGGLQIVRECAESLQTQWQLEWSSSFLP